MHQFIYLSIYISASISIHQFIYQSTYLSTSISIRQFIYLSIYLTIYLFIYLSIYLSIVKLKLCSLVTKFGKSEFTDILNSIIIEFSSSRFLKNFKASI